MEQQAEASTGGGGVRDRVSDAEWATRVDLAAFYRIVARYGWDDLILAHISARVPEEEAYLINPFGYLFKEITASSLLKVDLDGRKLIESPHSISPEANVLHGAILAARRDVGCVAHVHTVAGTAVSIQACGLEPISQMSMLVGASLAYHDYEGLVSDPAEGERLVRDLGDNGCMILRNHGLVATGASVAETLFRLYNLQRSCEIQVLSQAREQIPLRQAVVEHTVARLAAAPKSNRNPVVDLTWAALLRDLHRSEATFAD
jgi:ribulose-5-phosphate 4-epimerase/fuculose-1-phosphate aldolase